jgi:hypothetical protein
MPFDPLCRSGSTHTVVVPKYKYFALSVKRKREYRSRVIHNFVTLNGQSDEAFWELFGIKESQLMCYFFLFSFNFIWLQQSSAKLMLK